MAQLMTGYSAISLLRGECPRCETSLIVLEANLWRCPNCCQGFAIADGYAKPAASQSLELDSSDEHIGSIGDPHAIAARASYHQA